MITNSSNLTLSRTFPALSHSSSTVRPTPDNTIPPSMISPNQHRRSFVQVVMK
jgi:hypothetical protein